MTDAPRHPNLDIFEALHRARNHDELLTASKQLAQALLDQGVELADARADLTQHGNQLRLALADEAAASHNLAREREQADLLRAERDTLRADLDALRADLAAERELTDQLNERASLLAIERDELQRRTLEFASAATELRELAKRTERASTTIQRLVA